jgi:hypothetical protein
MAPSILLKTFPQAKAERLFPSAPEEPLFLMQWCAHTEKKRETMQWDCQQCSSTIEFDDNQALASGEKILLVCDGCEEVYLVTYPRLELRRLPPNDPWRRRMVEAHRRVKRFDERKEFLLP